MVWKRDCNDKAMTVNASFLSDLPFKFFLRSFALGRGNQRESSHSGPLGGMLARADKRTISGVACFSDSILEHYLRFKLFAQLFVKFLLHHLHVAFDQVHGLAVSGTACSAAEQEAEIIVLAFAEDQFLLGGN